MDPDTSLADFPMRTELMSLDDVAAYVMGMMEKGMKCCVIGSPDRYCMVAARVGQRAVERNCLARQRSGEVCLTTGGAASFYVNHKAFRAFDVRFDRLVRRGRRPWVIVSEDEDGMWESRSYDLWLRRGMVKPPRIAWYRLTEGWP